MSSLYFFTLNKKRISIKLEQLRKLFLNTLLSLFIAICLGSCSSHNIAKENLVNRTIGKHFHKKWFFSHQTNNEETTIPFKIIHGWIVVDVVLNDGDQSYPFIFDTGATTSIETEIASELNLIRLREFTTTDYNEIKKSVSLVNLNKLSIGKLKLTNVGVLSTHHELTACYGIKGVIGQNLMHGLLTIISYKNKTITLKHPNKSFNVHEFDSFKLKIDWRGSMYLKMKVNDNAISALIDTGSPNHILLNKSFESKMNPNRLVQKRIQFINGANSSRLDIILVYKSGKLNLNNLIVENDDLILISNSSNNIGNDFFSAFEEIAFDLKSNRLFLSKRVIDREPITLKNLGLGWKDGFVIVTSMVVNSKVQQLGFSVGDRVITINGQPVTSFKDACEFRTFEESMDLDKSDLNLTLLCGEEERQFQITSAMLRK